MLGHAIGIKTSVVPMRGIVIAKLLNLTLLGLYLTIGLTQSTGNQNKLAEPANTATNSDLLNKRPPASHEWQGCAKGQWEIFLPYGPMATWCDPYPRSLRRVLQQT
jgi:hypothetical protein